MHAAAATTERLEKTTTEIRGEIEVYVERQAVSHAALEKRLMQRLALGQEETLSVVRAEAAEQPPKWQAAVTQSGLALKHAIAEASAKAEAQVLCHPPLLSLSVLHTLCFVALRCRFHTGHS